VPSAPQDHTGEDGAGADTLWGQEPTHSLMRYHCPAWRRTWAACLLEYPIDSQKSSNIADFLLFLVFQHACALTIESSISAALCSSQGAAPFCHPSRIFLMLTLNLTSNMKDAIVQILASIGEEEKGVKEDLAFAYGSVETEKENRDVLVSNSQEVTR